MQFKELTIKFTVFVSAKKGWVPHTSSIQTPNNFQTPFRYLPDNFQTPSRHLIHTFQTPSRHHQHNFQTPCRHPPDTFQKSSKLIKWLGGWFQLHNIATSWLHLASWNGTVQIFRLAENPRFSPSVAKIQNFTKP